MKTGELGDRMRSLEYFHSIRLLPGVWAIVRVVGRSFSRFTEERFEKPFDARFRDLMVTAGRALLQELGGLYACTHSDEISVLLPRNWNLWDRELEKLVSISAGIASAAFTSAAGEPAHFDSRVWLGVHWDFDCATVQAVGDEIGHYVYSNFLAVPAPSAASLGLVALAAAARRRRR